MSATAESVSWHERARRLEFRTQAFIDGRYVDAASGATFDSINPSTGKLLARVASCDSEDIDRAVSSARAVFRKGSWANLAPAQRPGRQLTLLHERYAVGAATGEEMHAHRGEEAGVVIRGRIELTVGGAARVLGPGEAYYFASQLPHRFRNVGREACEIISACTPATF